MPKHQLIADQIALFKEKFCEKAFGSNGGYIMVLKKDTDELELQEYFSTAFSEVYEAGLGDAEKCVPKEIVIDISNQDLYDPSDAWDTGYNQCRSLTLERINKLRT